MKSGKLLVEKLGCQIFDLVRWLPSATIQRMDHLAQPEISTVVQAGRHSGPTMTETMTDREQHGRNAGHPERSGMIWSQARVLPSIIIPMPKRTHPFAFGPWADEQNHIQDSRPCADPFGLPLSAFLLLMRADGAVPAQSR